MAKNKFEYTAEILANVTDKYTVARDEGKLNADILAEIAKEYEGLNVRSLRAKLMVEKVYRKDTEAEKAAIAEKRDAEKANKGAKEEKVTKKMVAVAMLTDLGVNTDFADDLAKAKTDTLAALFDAVRELVKTDEAEAVAEAVNE